MQDTARVTLKIKVSTTLGLKQLQNDGASRLRNSFMTIFIQFDKIHKLSPACRRKITEIAVARYFTCRLSFLTANQLQ